ncbi:MAG: DUF2007 domain-containing protein [Rhodospirillaceae bacterium]
MAMIELMRTNDPVLLSWAEARLAALNVPVLVFDNHASVMEGNVVAMQRRLMIDPADMDVAATVLAEAEDIGQGRGDPLD